METITEAPKVINLLRTGDTVFYTTAGGSRMAMVTHVDKNFGEFDAIAGEIRVWGRATQVTAIHAVSGHRWECVNGKAFVD